MKNIILIFTIIFSLLFVCRATNAQNLNSSTKTILLEKKGAHYFFDTDINGVETSIMLESGIPALLLDTSFYTMNKNVFNCNFEHSSQKIRLHNKLHDILLKADASIMIGDVRYVGSIFIVSGITTPAMPFQHFKNNKEESSIVKIDLKKRVLQVLSRADLLNYPKDSLISFPLQFNIMGMPVIQTAIDISLQGRTFKLEDSFILDYGNGSNLFLLKGNYAVLNMIKDNKLQLSEAKNKDGIVLAEGVLFDSITLLGQRYTNVSVGLTDRMKFSGEAGLIGLKSLQQCLIFDIDNHKLYMHMQ